MLLFLPLFNDQLSVLQVIIKTGGDDDDDDDDDDRRKLPQSSHCKPVSISFLPYQSSPTAILAVVHDHWRAARWRKLMELDGKPQK